MRLLFYKLNNVQYDSEIKIAFIKLIKCMQSSKGDLAIKIDKILVFIFIEDGAACKNNRID